MSTTVGAGAVGWDSKLLCDNNVALNHALPWSVEICRRVIARTGSVTTMSICVVRERDREHAGEGKDQISNSLRTGALDTYTTFVISARSKLGRTKAEAHLKGLSRTPER